MLKFAFQVSTYLKSRICFQRQYTDILKVRGASIFSIEE
jgi:hypothetical protein